MVDLMLGLLYTQFEVINSADWSQNSFVLWWLFLRFSYRYYRLINWIPSMSILSHCLQKRARNLWKKIQPCSCQFYLRGIHKQLLSQLRFSTGFMETSWLVSVYYHQTVPLISPFYHDEINSILIENCLFQKPFLDGAEHLTEDIVSVFPAADSFEQYIIALIKSACEEETADVFCKRLSLYQVCILTYPRIIICCQLTSFFCFGWI